MQQRHGLATKALAQRALLAARALPLAGTPACAACPHLLAGGEVAVCMHAQREHIWPPLEEGRSAVPLQCSAVAWKRCQPCFRM